MDMLNPIYTEIAECQDCYKCIRECTVKAIKVIDGRAKVVGDLCILCGHCVSVCPAGAKRVRCDIEKAKHALSTKKEVYVSLAPSFVTEFTEQERAEVLQGLRLLGFAGVSETALGAEAVSDAVARQLRSGSATPLMISSACPVSVEYLRKYHPTLSPYVLEISSPLMAHALMLKKTYGEHIGVVFVGPCIGKKREADKRPDLIDAALTFLELRQWFGKEGISLNAVSRPGRRMEVETKNQDSCLFPFSQDGNLYPITGGMVQTLLRRGVGTANRFHSVSGIKEIPQGIDGLDAYNPRRREKEPLFLELLACPGGCVNGPGCSKRKGTVMKETAVWNYHRESAGKSIGQPSEKSLHLGSTQVLDLSYPWDIDALHPAEIAEEKVREALARVGKYCREDELNCGGCGYDTCRQFARAYLEGKAELTMCVSYTRKLAQRKADALLKAMPSGVVVVDENLCIVECNRNFAVLLGKEVEELYDTKPGLEKASLRKLIPFANLFETVLETGVDLVDRDIHYRQKVLRGSIFSVEPRRFVGGVFQDVTLPHIQKDRIVEQAEKIIRKQLSTVQKIAFLLGENAAESEVMLNAIIQSFGQEGS